MTGVQFTNPIPNLNRMLDFLLYLIAIGITMTPAQKLGYFLSSIALNLFILLIPFIMPIMYNEGISERKAYLSISVFLLNVALSSTRVSNLIFSLLPAILCIAVYGAIDPKSALQLLHCKHIYIAAFGVLILFINKIDLHYRKGEKLLNIR
mgnify:CR=1 FL=1